MTGRPTKLSPEIAKRILNAIRAGITREAAIAAAGISHSTFYSWLERGRIARCGKFPDFLDSLKRAEAAAAIRNITIIQAAALGGQLLEKITTTRPDGTVVVIERWSAPCWLAAKWWLERRFPHDWGRRNRVANLIPARSADDNFVFIVDRISE